MRSRLPWSRLLLAVLLLCGAAACTSKGLTCPAGQLACDGQCIDPGSDPLHCGACNVACYAGAPCTGGVCTCPAGTTACGTACVDLQTDVSHCGTCGHACGLGTCSAGTCACNPPPVALCPPTAAGTCVDTSASGANCGGCGIVCTPAMVCASSTCQCLAPNTTCDPGLPTEVCTNLATDPSNCGACGTACAAGYGCVAGQCRLTCPAGLTACGSRCVDLRTDPSNCGACGTACPSGTCAAGACQASCTTLTCGASCCDAPIAGNDCCLVGGLRTCPSTHRNVLGPNQIQTYFSCTAPFTYDATTAAYASGVWANDFAPPIATLRSCPDAGGSLCVVRQKGFGQAAECGVWCYQGPLEATLRVTAGYACPCPTEQGRDWW